MLLLSCHCEQSEPISLFRDCSVASLLTLTLYVVLAHVPIELASGGLVHQPHQTA